MNRLAVTKLTKHEKEYTTVVLLDEKRSFLDFQLYEPEEESLLNRIYIGRVENVIEGIEAAFVKISPTQKCFLPLLHIEQAIFTKKQSKTKAICVGDELLVQVVKDAVKTKEPVVSTKLTLQGACCVLTSGSHKLGVSKKVTAEQKQKLMELLSGMEFGQKSCGIVLRTCVTAFEKEAIVQDVQNIYDTFVQMVSSSLHREAFALMYQELPPYIGRIKSMDLSQVDVIYSDDVQLCQQIKEFLPYIADRVEVYRDDVISLNRLYQIETNLDKLLDKRVWLDSGANIILEQLETLTFIDVNTAKNQNRKKEAVLAVNMEAATEIVRQLRLRNISGMILIDFINMNEQDTATLISHLKKELKSDSCPCNFIDVTRLGLVELTRKKVHRSLKEIIR